MVFRSNFTLTGFNFFVTMCCPFLVASHGFSHRQAGLSHSRCCQHGSKAALSFPFGKAKVSQPQPRRVKLWQHYFAILTFYLKKAVNKHISLLLTYSHL